MNSRRNRKTNRPTLPTARLLGGRAHGHTVTVAADITGDDVWVTLLDGTAAVLIRPGEPGAVEQLNRAANRWELYVHLPGIGLDSESRRAYYCVRPLSDDAVRTDPTHPAPPANPQWAALADFVQPYRTPALPHDDFASHWTELEAILIHLPNPYAP